jgi:CheY-like chemotaxis protein/HPt (histidine-containing phosphotransfer) domain-containing protein
MVTGHEEEFRRLFIQEAEGQLATISLRARELESEDDPTEALHELFRQAHTMKGSSALVGFDAVRVVAHALEDLFEDLRSGAREADKATVAEILGAVETVREMIPALVRGEDRGAAAAEAATTLREVAKPGHQKSRVLVVDDALTAREFERSLLERAGYEVEVAIDGREALDRLATGSFDLVVADVDMPGIDGLRLTERIRAEPTLAGLPVVIVTSSSDEADRRRGLEAGANGYMVKSSLDDGALLEEVERALGGGA